MLQYGNAETGTLFAQGRGAVECTTGNGVILNIARWLRAGTLSRTASWSGRAVSLLLDHGRHHRQIRCGGSPVNTRRPSRQMTNPSHRSSSQATEARRIKPAGFLHCWGFRSLPLCHLHYKRWPSPNTGDGPILRSNINWRAAGIACRAICQAQRTIPNTS